jgi:hypothetical protein
LPADTFSQPASTIDCKENRLSTTWHDLASSLFADARFEPPATPADVDEAEKQLNVKLPAELRSLYLETNGIKANYGSSIVWPVAEMVAQNAIFRESADFAELYMPFDCLLFFGTEGNGDQFAYRILAGAISDTEIYEWDHENDSRVWFARDLDDFLRRSAVPR